MKYIIKHLITGCFWNGSGEWVDSIYDARQYSSKPNEILNKLKNACIFEIHYLIKDIVKPVGIPEFIVPDTTNCSLDTSHIHKMAVDDVKDLMLYADIKSALLQYIHAGISGKNPGGNPDIWINELKRLKAKYE